MRPRSRRQPVQTLTLRGRVSYIDPQVSADTRTAKVRIEVPNPGGELRLGMYADVVVAGASGTSTPRVPRNAVQNVGDRTVVYLANPKEPGKFIEREVRLGQTSGEQVEVVSGVQPGDVVVTEGSFFVRAERERLGLRPAAATSATPSRAPAAIERRTQQRGRPDREDRRERAGLRACEGHAARRRTSTPDVPADDRQDVRHRGRVSVAEHQASAPAE